MFSSEEYLDDFLEALGQKCYLQNSCDFDPENMEFNKTLDAGTEKESWEIRTLKMSEMISELCYERIFFQEITSTEYIGVLACVTDKIWFKIFPGVHFHKEELGLIAVCSDIVSIIVMYYVFGKLKSLNQEYLQILDDNVIRMQDFTIQVHRI